MKSDYHQVLIEKTDVCKKAFKSKECIFEWLVMHFVLTKALTTFMQMMDEKLWPFTNYFVVIYLDEILILKKTWEEHLKRSQQVLGTL